MRATTFVSVLCISLKSCSFTLPPAPRSYANKNTLSYHKAINRIQRTYHVDNFDRNFEHTTQGYNVNVVTFLVHGLNFAFAEICNSSMAFYEVLKKLGFFLQVIRCEQTKKNHDVVRDRRLVEFSSKIFSVCQLLFSNLSDDIMELFYKEVSLREKTKF